MTSAAVENGIMDPEGMNGVDEISVEDRFFEDISETQGESESLRNSDVITLREEDLPILNVENFSPEERSHLQLVLQRYAELIDLEGERQQQLKKDLDSVALKEVEDENANKVCHCCGAPLSFLLNRGKPCAQCTSSVCQNCMKQFREGVTKICEFCYLENMHEGRSGKWFMMNLQKSGRSPVFGTDVLRASLKRQTEEEERRLIAEQEELERQAALEAEAAIAAAQQLAASDVSGRSRHSKAGSNSSGGGSVASAPSSTGGKKWKFGKKNKKGSDAVDSDAGSFGASSLPLTEPIQEEVHDERSVDVHPPAINSVTELPVESIPEPSIPDSDRISSMSHAPPLPPAIEIEEGESVDEFASTVAGSHAAGSTAAEIPTIVVESTPDDEPGWKDSPYVNEENHIFPEDEPESESSELRAPSHMRFPSKTMSQESVLSIYSDTSAGYRLAVDVTGDVYLSLDYDFKHNIFLCCVKQCRDIAAVDTKRKKSDPYVKTYLLPDKTKVSKRKTSYRKNTLNPSFDEQLKYVISKSELETRVLSVAVWHRVAFGHNIFLGEAHIPMEDYEFGDPSPKWYPLHEKRDIAIPMPLMMYKGDLILAVKYIPGADLMSVSNGRSAESKGEVHVWIKEAKNLVAARANGYSDPFCKGYLLPDKSKTGKKKTRVIKRNLNPAWNTVLRFTEVEEEALPDRSLELTIWDYGRFSSNEFLGGLRLNLGIGVHQGQHVKWMDSKGHEITMWQAMISRTNTWIEGTLMLRPNMD